MKAPKVKDQCHCHECDFERKVCNGADVFYHCGTQASIVNFNNGLDSEASFKGNIDYIVGEILKKIDWPETLKDYDHIQFSARLIGYKKPKKCACDLKKLLKHGCQCGGS